MENENNIISIRRRNITLADEAFVLLMNKTELSLNSKAKAHDIDFRKVSASDLEKISCDVIKNVCSGTPFNPDEVKLISGARFPDIVAEQYYGVEVKSTCKNHWSSTGSSILETTRDKNVSSIYMLFGKLGGDPAEFRCRPYQDVLSDIAVTHSPRYMIDMTLKEGETIFDKMGTTYDSLRTSKDTIGEVKAYYKNKAKSEGRKEMPWWLESGNTDDSASPMNLRFWKDLDSSDKTKMLSMMFVLFPEVLASDYDNAVLWLCATFGVIHPHIRDSFSAGGKIQEINNEWLKKPVPHIYKRLVMCAPIIFELLNDEEFMHTHVMENNIELLDGVPVDIWLRQIFNITKEPRMKSWFLDSVSKK